MDESPPVADLHLHTTASDGRLTIDALPDAARAGGVDVVAVTDTTAITRSSTRRWSNATA